jgi:hypothetical protein
VEDLLKELAAHRRRIRAFRAVEAAFRWAFYASVLACLYLTASKVLGLSVPRSMAVTVLSAVPLAMAAREWARSFSLKDCAIYLDLTLGLEERLATAVEGSGAMREAQVADAAGALARAKLPPRRLPREARLLAASALILLALLVVPAPGRSGASGDPALAELLEQEAARLESVPEGSVEFREVREELRRAGEDLRRGRAEAALEKLEGVKERLEALALSDAARAGSEEARRLLRQASAGAEALAAQLAALGRPVHARPPAVAAAKLERQARAAAAPEEAAGDSPPVSRRAASALGRADWPPKYDPVVRSYLGRNP